MTDEKIDVGSYWFETQEVLGFKAVWQVLPEDTTLNIKNYEYWDTDILVSLKLIAMEEDENSAHPVTMGNYDGTLLPKTYLSSANWRLLQEEDVPFVLMDEFMNND